MLRYVPREHGQIGTQTGKADCRLVKDGAFADNDFGNDDFA